MKNISRMILACSVLILPACSPLGVATGVGASAGIAASQEGGISRAVNDAKIQVQINDAWFKYDVATFTKLDMTVNQGRVLLTGVVQDPEHRVEAVRLAWQPAGVTQVINEIKVAESTGIMGYARDSWISTRLRTSITLDKQVQSINYTIDTVQGTVYLMGVAQSQEELDRVIQTARTIPDVRQVVSYVKIAGPNGESAGSGGGDTQAAGAPAQLNAQPSEYYRDEQAYNGTNNINGGYVQEVKPVLEGSPNSALQDNARTRPSKANSAPVELRPVDRQTL